MGRTLALLLARERLRVALVAPPQPRSPQQKDVRAYALNASSRAVLQSLRCWPDDEDATPVVGMQVFGDLDGQIQFDAASQEVPALAWIVDVPALEQRLADARDDLARHGFCRSHGDLHSEIESIAVPMSAPQDGELWVFAVSVPVYSPLYAKLEADLGPRLRTLVRSVESVLGV